MSSHENNVTDKYVPKYVPVSCDMHSEFEVFIMHKQRTRLRWRDTVQNITHDETVLPVDLQTKNGAEYLQALNSDNKPISIRLDRIHDYKKFTE